VEDLYDFIVPRNTFRFISWRRCNGGIVNYGNIIEALDMNLAKLYEI